MSLCAVFVLRIYQLAFLFVCKFSVQSFSCFGIDNLHKVLHILGELSYIYYVYYSYY